MFEIGSWLYLLFDLSITMEELFVNIKKGIRYARTKLLWTG